MGETRRLISRYRREPDPVLVIGETGTGKGLVAHALHWGSGRLHQDPIVAVLASLGEMARAELFGYVSGAFTGALRDHEGYFKQADRSTLVLDDISDAPLSVQPLLLRAIEERRHRPLGATADVFSEARIVATSNRPLDEEVAAGRFREDLYERLTALRIMLPPLRQHLEDLRIYVPHFLKNAAGPGKEPKRLTDGALNVLFEYSWPRNVRQLANVLLGAAKSQDGQEIGADEIRRILLPDSARMGKVCGSPAPAPDRAEIMRQLHASGGNKRKAARELRISKSTLYRRMQELGIPLHPQAGTEIAAG